MGARSAKETLTASNRIMTDILKNNRVVAKSSSFVLSIDRTHRENQERSSPDHIRNLNFCRLLNKYLRNRDERQRLNGDGIDVNCIKTISNKQP